MGVEGDPPWRQGGLMGCRQRVAIGLAVGMLLAVEAGAHSPDVTVRVGDRIRYRIDGGAKAKARVIETGEGWLRVDDGSRTLQRIEKVDLSSLAVSRGKRRHPVAGAVIGGLVGIGMGFGFDEMTCEIEECENWRVRGFLGTCGAALGGLAGALITTDRWEEVPLSRVRFGLAPARGGGLQATIRLGF